MLSYAKKTPPKIGSVWKHNNFRNMYITIVDRSYARNSTRNIVYQYNSTGEIGGCNSCEWFYDDWSPA